MVGLYLFPPPCHFPKTFVDFEVGEKNSVMHSVSNIDFHINYNRFTADMAL